MNGVKMPNLEYIGSLAHYHGPCEIVDEAYTQQGRYSIVLPNGKMLINVRPQSILIIQD
jgi:hypothetical protein